MKREPDDAPERSVEVRGFRIDLTIAICALFVSSLATAASVWQSRVVAEQLSSQIWPYVAFQTSYAPNALTETISNEGLGPARVRWIRLLIDGKTQHTLIDAMHTLSPKKRLDLSGIFSDVTPGHVIRVGGVVQLFRITNRATIATVVRNYPRFQLEACYCPIIDGNCWITRSGGPGGGSSDPETVAQCPDRIAEMLSSGMSP